MKSIAARHGSYPGQWTLVATLLAVAQVVAADDKAVTLADVDTITIMPVAFPADPSLVERGEPMSVLYGTLDDYIYKALLRKLALKGYVLDRPRRWTRPPDWTVDNLATLSPVQVAERLPASATFAALLLVERVDADFGVVESEAAATVSAMILHRPSGRVVWDGRRQGEFRDSAGQFLLYGPLMMLITPDRHAAVELAFEHLFAALPEKAE